MKNNILEENNLFKFATKELSQDAFISWCINFYNYKNTDKNLYLLSKDILKRIIDKEIVNNIKNIEIKRQFCTIDILLILTLKDNTKHYVIIEDKIDSPLTKNQKHMNVDKLDPTKRKNNKKLNEIGITSFIPEKISLVLLKTGFEDNLPKDNPIKYKNHEYIYKKITSLDIYQILEKYTSESEIIDSYYKYLQFKLKTNNKLKDETVSDIRKREYLTIDETIFSKNYYCFNCFIHLIDEFKEEYTHNSHPSNGGVELKILTNELKDEFKFRTNNEHNKIYVDTIRFDNFVEITNTFNEDKSIWTETYYKNKNENTIRYIFLFGKNTDAFEKVNYVFHGLYKFKETITENNITKNIWTRCEVNKNKIIPLNKNEIIKIIREIEENEK